MVQRTEVGRVDLMFAFYPDVLPYRKETTRIRQWNKELEMNLLIWKREETFTYYLLQSSTGYGCAFENPEDDSDHYTDSVKRIIYSIPTRHSFLGINT